MLGAEINLTHMRKQLKRPSKRACCLKVKIFSFVHNFSNIADKIYFCAIFRTETADNPGPSTIFIG